MANTRALLFTLLAILFFSSAHGLNPSNPNSDVADQGSTLKIIHVNNPYSPFRSQSTLSWLDTILQIQSNDKARLQYLSSLVAERSATVPITSDWSITQNYIVEVKIGTPPQTLHAAFDTSNDAFWFPCDGCDGCSSPTFNSKKSSTFKRLHCGARHCKEVPNASCKDHDGTCQFNLTYASSVIDAYLVKDTITLTTVNVPGYTFGCVYKTTGNSFPKQGLLGLGRGPLSLISQSGSPYKSIFSYCLPNYNSSKSSGSLILGPNIQPKEIKTTQLLKSLKRPSLYYVNLMHIIVGTKVVNIPSAAFAFDPKTGAGTVIDSGAVFTSLVKSAYLAVRDEVRLQMSKGQAKVSSLGGFDTCYNVPFNVPATITFMFSGMNMTIPKENFIIHSHYLSTSCLAMAAVPDGNVNSNLNIIASYQQQNQRVLIDVPNTTKKQSDTDGIFHR
ncbi:hypothetical protein CASFOL_035574 [Castilleja foliolosa]|uniref:Peptidase A1 domain-containing protein n=1 Tax=Castilleja foliolosa TaxID=1961234 RepID=A0ABD3BTR4_9LAMI